MPLSQNDDLVDRIYEAAVVPELWRGVLRDFAKLAGASEAVLIAASRATNRWITSSPHFDELVDAHFVQFPTNERTRRLLASRHAGFVRDCDVFTQAEIDIEPVFQEFLIPRGYGVGAATAIFAPSGDAFIVHCERTTAAGPFSSDVVASIDSLRPHFARAALLSARLELERARATAEALELIGLPAAVLGLGGKAMAANDLLAGLMPDVVQDRPSRLALTDAKADSLLVAATGQLAFRHDGGVRSIPVAARAERPPVIFHLVPVRGAAHDIFSRAIAILIATLVVPKEVPTADVVQGLFDLTPSEAKLATLVAAGNQPREASQKLRVSEETARTTLKRVLTKTGLHRQADLIALLQGLKPSS